MTDDPWFVRSRKAGRYTINPVARGGWLLLIGYGVLTLASAPLLLLGIPVGLWSFVGVVTLLSIVFVVTAWRTSVPEAEWRGRPPR